MRLLARTIRLKIDDRERFLGELQSNNGPLIVVFWHEDLVGAALTFLRLRNLPRVTVMISRSRDGERLSRVITRLGMYTVRASSSKGAVQGFLEMKHLLTRGMEENEPKHVGVLALDGPRGPRRKAKPGTALLARRVGARVLPVAFEHSRRIVFGSWDRMRLPWPFARTNMHIGPLLDARDWPDDDSANAARLASTLNELKNEMTQTRI